MLRNVTKNETINSNALIVADRDVWLNLKRTKTLKSMTQTAGIIHLTQKNPEPFLLKMKIMLNYHGPRGSLNTF